MNNAHVSRRLRLATVSAAAAAALALGGLTGCAADDAPAGAAADTPASAATEGTWPRTVTVGDGDVELAAAPQRIVALSTETADLALQLAGPERLVAVPTSATDPSAGNQVDAAKQVEVHLATGTSPDPEQILSLEPDLVIMTGRHGAEQSASDLLAGSGVPTATFTSADFAGPLAVAESVERMGELLGEEAAAGELSAGIAAEVDDVEAAVADAEDRPTAIVLFQRGGQKMIMGANSATTSMVEQAGGVSLAADEGWHAAVPADPETILRLDPDVIFVQDFRGAGRGPFEELLRNPALAGVAAIEGDRVEVLDARTTSGTAGTRIGEGLRAIAAALHRELF